MIVDQALKEATAELAATAGVYGEPQLQVLSTHGHNRMVRVEIGDAVLALKRYFPGPGDRRDRLRAEFTFSRFAWAHGVRALPEPMAADYTRAMALFRFVDGERASAAPIGLRQITAAIAFIEEINRERNGIDARGLPAAYGACFSIEEHEVAISTRLGDLRERADRLGGDDAVVALIDTQLRPAWSRVVASLIACPAVGASERCLSPSDFGFHNALTTAGGEVIFHDFEYAGWDDPARLVAEMFTLPQAPAPAGLLSTFASGLREGLDLPDSFIERAMRMLPLHRLRHCCALLDEILPRDRRRKGPSEGREQRWIQLQRAVAGLHDVEA